MKKKTAPATKSKQSVKAKAHASKSVKTKSSAQMSSKISSSLANDLAAIRRRRFNA